MAKNETTRWSKCVYTHRPTVNQLYGSEKNNCRKCETCLGKLAYQVWFETFNLDSWIEEKEDYIKMGDNYRNPFTIERINSEIEERTKIVLTLQNKAKNIRRI